MTRGKGREKKLNGGGAMVLEMESAGEKWCMVLAHGYHRWWRF